MKYLHVSIAANGKRGEGVTFNAGRNQAKRTAMPNRKTRSGRKWIKALRRANPAIMKALRDKARRRGEQE